MAENSLSNMSKNLKAVEIIAKELSKVDKKDIPDIVQFAFKQIGYEASLPAGVAPINSVQGNSFTPANNNVGNGSPDLNLSMDRFVAGKRPVDNYQKVAVIAYYLKNKEGKAEFKNAEMEKIHTSQARIPKIGNLADVMSKAKARHKFFTRGSASATNQLSVLGEDVVEALPDQHKVAELIATSKIRKTSKKKATKKKVK